MNNLLIRDSIVQSLSIVHPEWLNIFKSHQDELKKALEVLKEVDDIKNITPPVDRIFATFSINPYDIKVVIIGQDPYPGKHDANGLSFSSDAKTMPKSFINIAKCLTQKGYDIRTADLRSWLFQGIMLLNMSLTTIVDKRGAHTSKWKDFITNIITDLTTRVEGIHFMLWGNDAKAIKPYIKGNQHIHEWTHPSPMIDNKLPIDKRFEHCDNFDTIEGINWSTKNETIIYTDGAVVLHKKAGYAVYIPELLRLYGRVEDAEYLYTDDILHTKEHTSKEPTSQRGEYLAIINALYIIKRLDLRNVILVTDSLNAKGIITEWTKNTEKYLNSDLVYIMRLLYNQLSNQVEIVHTKSHNKDKASPYNKGNTIVDRIARYALTLPDFDKRIDFTGVEIYI